MNRRNFIQKSSFAAIAAAGLPLAIRNQENAPSRYKTELKTGQANQTYFEVGIYHNALEHFSAAKDEDKVIGLKVKFYETTDLTKPTSSGDFRYTIQKVELEDKDSHIWKVTTKLNEKISGDYEFPKNYPKHLTFRVIPGTYVNLLGKKDATLVSVPFPPTGSTNSSGDEECFLTTACVGHRNLPDNCEELETLRFLRDQFMVNDQEGKNLIDQYRVVGPEIVRTINSFRNKSAIYDYMHREMILPSVMLVKEGRYAEAVAYYKTFVKALKNSYC
jgi:hypothetical protein